MESDASLNSKSNTTRSRLRLKAIYTPSPEHKFAPGIPARNLSEGEVEWYGVDNLRNAQCYELVEIESLEELVQELAPEETEE